MRLYFFLLVSLKKEKKKHKTFNTVSQEATTNRWGLAFDMKTFLHWIIVSIAFVSLSKEVFACRFYVRLKVLSVLSLHPDVLAESLG